MSPCMLVACAPFTEARARRNYIQSLRLDKGQYTNKKIKQLRYELQLFKRQFRQKNWLTEHSGIFRKELMTLCRAEWQRRRTKERTRKCTAFPAYHLGFPNNCQPKSAAATLHAQKRRETTIFENTNCDAARGEDLIYLSGSTTNFKLQEGTKANSRLSDCDAMQFLGEST